jgi:hypothetical protein
MDTSKTKPENGKNINKIEKTFSNIQKAKKVIKDRLFIWNCCFCPHLQSVECCKSCEIDVQSQIGL